MNAPWGEHRILQRLRPPYEPRNVVSNLAYGLVGGWIALQFQDSASATFAVALFVLMTGSALYHGYRDAEGDANSTDWSGMVAVFAVLGGLAWGLPWWVAAALALAMIAVNQRWLRYQTHRDWVLGLGLVLASLPPALGQHWAVLGASWACFAVAYLFWTLDRSASIPIGRWGHAFWHILTAIAFGLLFTAQRGL